MNLCLFLKEDMVVCNLTITSNLFHYDDAAIAKLQLPTCMLVSTLDNNIGVIDPQKVVLQ